MEAQRTRILRAAFECIAENGIEGASIGAICRQAGLSAGAVYIHFRSKDEIIAETVRYAPAEPIGPAADWPALKTALASFSDLLGFELVTVVRARLHLNAAVVRSGQLHDMLLPMMRRNLLSLAANLQRLHDDGRIRLRTAADETAASMFAYVDGMLWIGLAHRLPLPELERRMRRDLDCFVEVLGNGNDATAHGERGPARSRRATSPLVHTSTGTSPGGPRDAGGRKKMFAQPAERHANSRRS